MEVRDQECGETAMKTWFKRCRNMFPRHLNTMPKPVNSKKKPMKRIALPLPFTAGTKQEVGLLLKSVMMAPFVLRRGGGGTYGIQAR